MTSNRDKGEAALSVLSIKLHPDRERRLNALITDWARVGPPTVTDAVQDAISEEREAIHSSRTRVLADIVTKWEHGARNVAPVGMAPLTPSDAIRLAASAVVDTIFDQRRLASLVAWGEVVVLDLLATHDDQQGPDRYAGLTLDELNGRFQVTYGCEKYNFVRDAVEFARVQGKADESFAVSVTQSRLVATTGSLRSATRRQQALPLHVTSC
jgi:hypothetical protein